MSSNEMWYCDDCSSEVSSWVGFVTHFPDRTEHCPYCGGGEVYRVPGDDYDG